MMPPVWTLIWIGICGLPTGAAGALGNGISAQGSSWKRRRCRHAGRPAAPLEEIVTCSETLPSDGGEQPDAGCVFVARGLGTRGLPFHRFKGEGGRR